MTRSVLVRRLLRAFLSLGSFFAISHSCAYSGTISVVPNPTFDSALENTGERSILVTVTNTSVPNAVVLINEISVTNADVNGPAQFLAGEQDDAAIYTGLVLPSPPPYVLPSKGDHLNVRVKWKPVDVIIDNDVDFGNWFVNLRVRYDTTNQVDTSLFMQTYDAPEPAIFGLLVPVVAGFMLRRKNSPHRV